MRKLNLILLVSFLSFTCKSQEIFSFSDSVFDVGKIHPFTSFRYAMCGSHSMLVDSLNIAQIDSLIAFMEEHKHISIEIGVHTESRGSDSMNLKLTEWRAQEARQYFIRRGVPEFRIQAKGYGETQLIISEEEINKYKKTDKRMYETLHQRNRRTEIKIIAI